LNCDFGISPNAVEDRPEGANRGQRVCALSIPHTIETISLEKNPCQQLLLSHTRREQRLIEHTIFHLMGGRGCRNNSLCATRVVVGECVRQVWRKKRLGQGLVDKNVIDGKAAGGAMTPRRGHWRQQGSVAVVVGDATISWSRGLSRMVAGVVIVTEGPCSRVSLAVAFLGPITTAMRKHGQEACFFVGRAVDASQLIGARKWIQR
jgi:hypothetical protein